MLIIIALIIAALITTVLVLASTKPESFKIQRSITIQAAPETIFALIQDFKQWANWSPWEHLDPSMNRHYSGAENGLGAIYEWNGKGKVGAGRMEIIQINAPTQILIKLDFIKPFEGHNQAEFTLTAEGNSTNLSWTMTGPSPFMSKVMQVFCDLDAMIGKDFEAGLVNVKNKAEGVS